MPDSKQMQLQEKHDYQCAGCCNTIADQHDGFLIPSVTDYAGKDTQKHIRGIRAHGEHGGFQSRTAILIEPQHQCKIGHSTPQRGERLCQPKNQKNRNS